MRRLIPAVLWTALIATLLTVPGSYVPSEAWDFDKVGHFGMFAGFSFLWIWALAPRIRRPFVWIGISGLVFAVGSEVVQGLLSTQRAGDPWDALADILGLLAGMIAIALMMRMNASRSGVGRGPTS